MIDGLPLDGVHLVFQGDENLGSVLESPDGGIGREDSAYNEEHGV